MLDKIPACAKFAVNINTPVNNISFFIFKPHLFITINQPLKFLILLNNYLNR